jgi:hypothetical protein
MPSNTTIDKTKSNNPTLTYPEALQDTIHQEIGKSRAGKSGKSRLKS